MNLRHFCTLSTRGGLLWFALLALCGGYAAAAEVEGLYAAAVTVSSRDDERERQSAFSTAMREVLLKLSGRDDTTANPVIARALATPQAYVETWAYNSIIPEDPLAQPGAPAQILLNVSFFQTGIQQLMGDAGIPVWPRNRPDTLLWIVVQDELGERFRASDVAEEGGDLIAVLEAEAASRGVPVLLPLQDLVDLRALPVEQLWNFDLNALRIASNRYRSESILALRVFRLLSGDVIGKAVYIFRDQVLEFEVFEAPLEELVDGSIDLVAESLASYYAIRMSAADSSSDQRVLMTVDGIGSARDYAGVLQYLNGLAVVSTVQVLSAQGATLELRLSTGGQYRQLVESLALDRRLTALGEVTQDGQQVRMHYQWLPQP